MKIIRGRYGLALVGLFLATGVVAIRWERQRLGITHTVNSFQRSSSAPHGSAGDLGAWMDSQRGGSPDAAAIQSGVELARQRRIELSALMKHDPAAALARVLSYSELEALPPAVRAECEQPWSGTGSIDLRWATTAGTLEVPGEHQHHCQHQNIAFVGEDSWRIYGPDFVEPHPPRTNAPMQGYRIGNELLLESSAVHRLSGTDLTAAKDLFPVGNPDMVDPLTGGKADPAIAAVTGGKLYYFEGPSSVGAIDTRLAEASTRAEQNRTAALDHGMGFLEASPPSSGTDGSTPVEATPYLGNAINVLFIRVDFSDFPGEPVSKSSLESTLSTVNTFVTGYSYNQASVSYTVTPTWYRMPATGASYATAGNNDGLMSAAKTLATNAGYNLANYSVVAVYFPSLGGVVNSQITYAGLASVGGGNHWINGDNDPTTITHEFGHNFGLFHANYWDPDHDFDGIADYNDPAGNSFEYGDLTDTMGSGPGASGYFNPFETRRLEWLPANKVVEPAASGTWRISRFDDPSALSNQTLALRVPMGGNRYYWVGLRKRFTTPTNFLNAAYVVGENLYPGRSNLIDMTPNSSGSATNDRRDAGLIVGANYYDSSAGVKFETLAAGGTAPNEWIDVKITFDSRISIVDTTPEVDEKAGTALITVRRSFGSTGAASVSYATANGTATAGTDYYATSGTLTWASGDTADKIVRVPIRPDTLNEGRETFSVQLSGATGATLDGQASSATVTLVDAGKQLLKFAPGFFNLKVSAIAPLADGKTLIGGLITPASGEYQDIHNFARLNADGSVDGTFLTGTGFDAEVLKIVVQPDGKILVGGLFSNYNGTPANRLVRLNANGTLDTAFMTAIGAGPSSGSKVTAFGVEAPGSILVGGNFTTFSGATTKGLVRLTSGGARDTVNVLNLPFDPGSSPNILDLLVQDDGKIMAAGSFYIGSTGTGFRPGVARLNADGTRDTSFDPDAGPHGSSVGQLGYITCIARQNDGRYLVGGSFTNYDEHPAIDLARINTNGSFDSSFSGPAFNNVPQDIVVQGSGGVVVGGWFTSPASYLTRLTSAGAVDTSFLSGAGPGGNVYQVVESPDGGLFVGGNFFLYDGVDNSPVVKVAGGTSPYLLWAGSQFTAAQFTAGLTDPEDDPDGDGIRNGTEFALGTNPRVSGVLPSTTSLVTNAANRYLQVSLDRSSQVAGVWCVAQFSNDLVNWLPAAPVPGSNATYDVLEDSGSKFIVRDKTAVTGTPKRFGRIVFKLPQ